ncbi:MAG TPA: hypothetical protein VF241_13470 [Propionibacteriaceae bacterium]
MTNEDLTNVLNLTREMEDCPPQRSRPQSNAFNVSSIAQVFSAILIAHSIAVVGTGDESDPERVDIRHRRALIRQRRGAGLSTITLPADDVDSMIIAGTCRMPPSGANARHESSQATPSKITFQNVDQDDQPRSARPFACVLAIICANTKIG